MNIIWWQYKFPECKTCDVVTLCHEFLFASDGEYIFVLVCPKCGEKSRFETHAGRLRALANKLDTEKAMADKAPTAPRKPVKPPVKPPKDPNEILRDEAFLHEMGITSADVIPNLLPPPKPEEPPLEDAA